MAQSEIPVDFAKVYQKAKEHRDFASRMIAEYTSQWVKAQKKIIELEDFIEKRRG